MRKRSVSKLVSERAIDAGCSLSGPYSGHLPALLQLSCADTEYECQNSRSKLSRQLPTRRGLSNVKSSKYYKRPYNLVTPPPPSQTGFDFLHPNLRRSSHEVNRPPARRLSVSQKYCQSVAHSPRRLICHQCRGEHAQSATSTSSRSIPHLAGTFGQRTLTSVSAASHPEHETLGYCSFP